MGGIRARALKLPGTGGLSFTISQYYPEKLLWIGPRRCIVMGQSGETGVCSLLALRFGRKGIADALNAARLLGSDLEALERMPSWKARVAVAEGMINSKLAERLQSGSIGIASHIVAHELAGFGPISLIMEEVDGPLCIDVSYGSGKIAIRHPSLGACRTNMRFIDGTYLAGAVARLSNEVSAQKDNGEVDISISRTYRKGGMPEERIESASIVPGRIPAETMAQPEALAYLWMALDAGLNILVSCSKLQAPGFLSVLGRLLPDYHRNALLGSLREPIALKGFIHMEVNDARQNIDMSFDRIFCIGVDAIRAKPLFKAALAGIPIVLAACFTPANAPSILMQKPYSVDPAQVDTLEVSVTLSASGLIDSIAEYRWPSMAETPYRGDGGFDMVETCRNGAIDYGALSKSKVIRKYSKINVLSSSGAFDELRKRARHLSNRQNGIAEYRIGRLWKPARAAKA